MLSYLNTYCLASFQVFRYLNGVAFFSGESQALRVLAGEIFKRHDTHSYQIASVNSLKTLRYHRLNALDRTHTVEELVKLKERCGRRDDLMVSALYSGSNGPGLSHGRLIS